jgi:hypothetical protein
LGLHGGQPFVPQFDGSASGIGDFVGDRSGVTRSGPLPATHVKRQSDDEPHDAFLVREIAKSLEKSPFVSGVEDPARVGQEAEIVVNCHSNTHAA